MADITMCGNHACPQRTDCYRAMAVADPYRQQWFMHSPRDGEVCTYFWPMKDNINKNPKDNE